MRPAVYATIVVALLTSSANASDVQRLASALEDGVYATAPADDATAEGDCVQARNRRVCLVASDRVLFSGNIVNVRPADDPDVRGRYVVQVQLSQRAAEIFEDLTTRNVGKEIAVVVDGAVVTSPTVYEPIASGDFQIEGDFSGKEANEIAVTLRRDLVVHRT
ncbi:MAG: hypothetical protein QM759_02125 [Terricaulis sp.]